MIKFRVSTKKFLEEEICSENGYHYFISEEAAEKAKKELAETGKSSTKYLKGSHPDNVITLEDWWRGSEWEPIDIVLEEDRELVLSYTQAQRNDPNITADQESNEIIPLEDDIVEFCGEYFLVISNRFKLEVTVSNEYAQNNME